MKFNFDKESFKAEGIQFLYNVIFAGASASIGTGIACYFIDSIDWKILWTIMFLSILIITGICNCILSHIFPNYTIVGEPYKEDPVYVYHDYCNGYAIVEKVEYTDPKHKTAIIKFSFIDKLGNPISYKWYDGVSDFYENGVAVIYNVEDDKYNIMDGSGKELMHEWVNKMESFEDGVAKVYKFEYDENGNEHIKINFVDNTGMLIWEDWKETL
jgi:hypothetical protein